MIRRGTDQPAPVARVDTMPSAKAVRYIGAEMRGGSDGPGRLTAAALEFIGPLPSAGSRVLLAGPHRHEVVDALVGAGYRVDVQLRAVTDAEAAALRLPEPVGILCGSLTRVEATYDVVIALGGLEYLASADAPVDDWSSALDALTAVVTPGGLLAIVVRNGFGIDRLTSVPPGRTRLDSFACARQRVADRLAAAGFTTAAEIALYPSVTEPAILVSAHALAVADEAVATLVATAYRSTIGRRDTLADPRRVARDSITHGLGIALPPGWLIIAQHGAPTSSANPIPDVLSTDPPRRMFTTVPMQRVDPESGGSWLHPDALADTDDTEHHGGVIRQLGSVDAVMPRGPLLEEQMLEASGAYDMLALRTLLGGYARWLGVRAPWPTDSVADAPPAVAVMEAATDSTDMVDVALDDVDPVEPCPPDRVFAVADNVVSDAVVGGLRPIDPTWRLTDAVPANIVFVAALIRFADRLLASGLPHPWVTGQVPSRLAARLASMVGLDVGDDVLTAAADLADRQAMVLDSGVEVAEPAATTETSVNVSHADAQLGTPVANPTSPHQSTASPPLASPPLASPPLASLPTASLPVPSQAAPTESAATEPALGWSAPGARGLVGPVESHGPLAAPRGLAAALRTIDALNTELSGAKEQLNLLSATIAERDRRLDKVTRQLAIVKRSRAFRIANAVRKPVLALLGLARRIGPGSASQG